MKITYKTKIGLLPKKERINQWWDEDGNEVKNVVNTNSDELDAIKESGNNANSVDFTKTSGNYVGSPEVPIITTPIALDKTNAVAGGFSVIWYSGSVLTKNDFTIEQFVDAIVIFSGENILDELCRVVIDFDKQNQAFCINIQRGFTGDIPGVDTSKPNQMIITDLI